MQMQKTDGALSQRLLKRLIKYSSVGMGTYMLDILIIAFLVFVFSAPERFAVGLGFLIGITTNYLVSYYWVFRGTHRNKFVGYAIFVVLAIVGIFAITESVIFLTEQYDMHLLIARTIVAAFVGLINFLVNTFFNFKLL